MLLGRSGNGASSRFQDTRLLLISRFFMSSAQSLATIGMPVVLLKAGAGIGLVGTLLAASTATRLVETIVVGMLADRGVFRPFFILFPLATLVGSLSFFLGGSILAMSVGTVVAGFGGGSGANSGGTGAYKPAEYGWLVRNYADDARNKVVSNFSASSVAGVVLASLVALDSRAISGFLRFGVSSMGQARMLMAAVALLALVPALLGARIHSMPRVPRRAVNPERGALSRWGRAVLPGASRQLMRQLSVIGIFNGIANGSFGSFVVLWLVVRFHTGPVELGLTNLLISTTAFFGDLSCSYIARVMGLVRSVFVTRMFQALVIIPVAFAPNLMVAGVLLVVRQFAQRLNQPLRDSYVLARARPHEKARISAMSNVSSQAMQAVSNQVSGQLIPEVGFAPPFLAAALLQMIGGVLFFHFYGKTPPPEEDANSGIQSDPMFSDAKHTTEEIV